MQPPIHSASRAIEVSGLCKSFGKTSVLKDLELSVAHGEFLVILGDSGCGKSTLLKLITGLESPNSGGIRVHGIDQARVAPHRRDVAMVFQDGNGYEHLTVRKNLSLVAKSSGVISQIGQWSERLRITHTMEQRLDQLSGGELQRVAIARAMLSNKSVVLLDEPLSHLNQSLREEIRELIVAVHRESKKTFVYVTHDSDEAFLMADRIAILSDGRILQVDTPRTVYRKPLSKSVAQLLGQPTIDIVSLPRTVLRSPTSPTPPVLKNRPTSDGEATIECGLRCHDWTLSHISADANCDQGNIREEMVASDTELVLYGAIHSCRWLGSRWLLGVKCHGEFKILCKSNDDGEQESAFLLAERLTKENRGEKSDRDRGKLAIRLQGYSVSMDRPDDPTPQRIGYNAT